jgi:hypothetical protein
MSTTAVPRTPDEAEPDDELTDPDGDPEHPANPAAITRATTLTRCVVMPSATHPITYRLLGHSPALEQVNGIQVESQRASKGRLLLRRSGRPTVGAENGQIHCRTWPRRHQTHSRDRTRALPKFIHAGDGWSEEIASKPCQ